MKLLILLLLLSFCLNSQEIERFYAYPKYTIDSINNDKFFDLNFEIKKDDEFSILSTNIYDLLSNKQIANSPEFELIENLNFKLSVNSDLKLGLVEVIKTNADAENNKTAYGYRLISQLNELQKIGKTLILVDNLIVDALKDELNEYKEILKLSGIECDIRVAPRSEEFDYKKVLETKDIIDNYYEINSDLENIIIIGRVAYAMSGRYTPDGHIDESYGAWPTDLFYGVMNGQWTDTESDTTNPIFFPNHKNLKDDGKFDNGYIPGEVKFNIGRIDMYDLPFYEESEVELIKRYFAKDIEFRKGNIRPHKNAIMDNGFENVYRERFATEAMINFGALFGEGNYEWKKSRNVMSDEEYLFFWGAAPGAMDNIFDIVYAEEISNRKFNSVFTTLFGSRAVEWTFTNNIMRSVIANESMALTSRWGVRPYFYTFFMGCGKTIGYCHTYSLNSPLKSNESVNMKNTVHQTLLGDPTLKMYYPKMPENVKLIKKDNNIEISWDNSENAFAYNIYYKEAGREDFELLNNQWIRDNKFEFEDNFSDGVKFIVKSIEKVENNQGYYFEESIGAKVDLLNSVEFIDESIIYPNPSNGIINFRINVSEIRIIDLLGNEVLVNDNSLNSLDISHLQNGNYFVSYRVNNNIKIEKIIIYN